MKGRKKIQTIAVFIFLMLTAGFICVALVLFFVLISGDLNFNLPNITALYQRYNIFYLLYLIPFFSALAGAVIGFRYVRKIDERVNKELYFRKTQTRIIQFAKKISSGDLTFSFHSLNGDRNLAEALEGMRENLIQANRRESERMLISERLTELNDILRQVNDIHTLADRVISFLVDKLDNFVQGAFYIATSEDQQEKLVMISTYAYNRKKYLKSEFYFAQGLVGQAAVEKDFIYRTEIPENYPKISSALMGHKKPVSIFILPLINNDRVYGVIELGSVNTIPELQRRLITSTGEIIARTIDNVRTNEKTRTLLEESERMRKELLTQKQQLVKSSEEMARAREELEHSNSKLGEQIQEVHRINRKTQVILENSLEVIFIFSPEGQTLYVSPSIQSLLGYNPEEIIGKQDVDNIHPQDTESFRKFMKDIISFPEKKHQLKYRYFTKSGDILWLEATGKNSVSDVIRGIVINTRDISEQRLAEKEQRMRAKMQALSENSLDLILRLDIFSRCTYINPVVEHYTNLKISDFINKPLGNIDLDEEMISFFRKMLDEVAINKKKKSDEMILRTESGNMIMEVSAIPEFQENGETESVLFVCHDITEARKREELLNKKNKSINDSIQYAYYIQDSLMPTEQQLRSIIPTSFMIYKPKDIVSGDYPFLCRKGDNVYIGAMDCTGHGVPGALMSIIGHFLQNEILQKFPDDNAGDILDKLHRNVVSKLRQEDENSMINDGMDAAFCKIDLKNGILNYAGAHRPLYFVSKGEFTEIRGDRFPVGSTQYSNRKNFTNHSIAFTPGDAFYMMTDGYADQFGGPTGKQKFFSGRVNMLIKENTNLSIFRMGKLFDDTYQEWKGSVPQVDDVLVIGFKM